MESGLIQNRHGQQPTQQLYDVSKMIADKDREIERLKPEIRRWQEKTMVKKGGEKDIVILSTDLLSEMFSASRGGKEIRYFYLKAKDGTVIGYETNIRRSKDEDKSRNATAIYMLDNDNDCEGVDLHSALPL